MRKDGYWSGWQEYRYGEERRQVTLAGGKKPRPIHNQDKQKHLVAKAMDLMKDWRQSPFEHEGTVRAGLRSELCLKGHSWSRSDIEADTIVSAGLRRMGAKRPTWDEGQRQYTDSPDFCSWCKGPMDDEVKGRRQRFCSAECAIMAVSHLDRKSRDYVGVILRSAQRLITKLKAPPKPCEYCGNEFQSDREDARFCSPTCTSRWQKGDLLLKDIVCVGCGKTCKPAHRGATCCSHSCASAVKWAAERARLSGETRQCQECKTEFTPTAEKCIFCSPGCASAVAKRSWYDRNYKPAEHHLTCQWCGTGYVSKMPWSTSCGRECRQQINHFGRPTKRPRPITPYAFDYMFKARGPLETVPRRSVLTAEVFDQVWCLAA